MDVSNYKCKCFKNGINSNSASATPQASTDPNELMGNKALLVNTMATGERKEYEMTADKIDNLLHGITAKQLLAQLM